MATLGGSRKICVVEVCDYTWSPTAVPHMLSRGTPIVIDHGAGNANAIISYGAAALQKAQKCRHALGVLSEAVSTQDVMVNGSTRNSSGSKKRKRRVNIMALPLTFTGPEMCHSDTPHEGFAPGDFVFLVARGGQTKDDLGYKLAAETRTTDAEAICIGRASVNAPPSSHCVQTFINPLSVAFDRSRNRPIPRNVTAQTQFINVLASSVRQYNDIVDTLTTFGDESVGDVIETSSGIQAEIDDACAQLYVDAYNAAADPDDRITLGSLRRDRDTITARMVEYNKFPDSKDALDPLVDALQRAINAVKAAASGRVEATVTIKAYDQVPALDAFNENYTNTLSTDYSLIGFGGVQFDVAQARIDELSKEFTAKIKAIADISSYEDLAKWAADNSAELAAWQTTSESIVRA